MKIAIVLFVLLTLTGCGRMHGVAGSGVIKTEKRPVSSFTAIDASGAFDVEVACQKEPSLELEGDDNLLPLVKTEVRGGTLFLKPEKNFSVKSPIKVRISVQNLENISSSGAGSFRVTDLKTDKLRVDTSGASNLEISGTTASLELEMSGASKIDTEKLKAERVKINLSGAGKATVFASVELNAEVSGAGEVVYSGNPKTVNKSVSGVGKVSKKDTAA